MSTINLLPEDFLDRRQRRRATVICSALFAVVMAGVIAATLASEQSYRHTLEVRERVNADYVEAARLIQQMQQLATRKQQLLDKAKRSASLMERLPRSYLLAMVTNCLPEHTSLESVQMELEEIEGKKTKPTKYAKTKKQRKAKPVSNVLVKLTVTGYAATDVEVARLIASLARNPLPESVDLVYSEEKEVPLCKIENGRKKAVDEVTARQFQIEIIVKMDADSMRAIQQSGRLAQGQTEVRL